MAYVWMGCMISRELSVLVLIPANATTDLDSAWLKKKRIACMVVTMPCCCRRGPYAVMHRINDDCEVEKLFPTTRPLSLVLSLFLFIYRGLVKKNKLADHKYSRTDVVLFRQREFLMLYDLPRLHP